MPTVYSLKNPITQKIYYVGYTAKTIADRLVRHLYSLKQKTTIELYEAGIAPIIEIIEEGDAVTKITELYWIQKLAADGCCLENVSGLVNYQNVDKSGFTPYEVVQLSAMSEVNQLKFALEKIKSELPLSSSIPIVLRIKNIIEYALVTSVITTETE